MKYVYITLILILSGCGNSKNGSSEEVYKEPELHSFSKIFRLEMGVNVDHVELRFKKLSDTVMGLCYSWTNGDRLIEINDIYWSSLDSYGKTQLMYHELGHCALDLKHEERLVRYVDSTYVYGSIMYPHFFGDSLVYHSNEDKYKIALKNKTLVSF
jgi:hypothetical protein